MSIFDAILKGVILLVITGIPLWIIFAFFNFLAALLDGPNQNKENIQQSNHTPGLTRQDMETAYLNALRVNEMSKFDGNVN